MAKHILVIDDDASVRTFLMQRLEKEGYKVSSFDSEMSALHTIRNFTAEERKEIFSIFLDIELEDPEIFETLKKLLLLEPHFAVIMLTGPHQEAEAERAIQHGAFEIVTKPIDFAYLLRILDQLDRTA